MIDNFFLDLDGVDGLMIRFFFLWVFVLVFLMMWEFLLWNMRFIRF